MKLTVPVPEPVEFVVIQGELLTADHAQPALVVTVNELLPPEAPKLWLVELRLNVQFVAPSKLME